MSGLREMSVVWHGKFGVAVPILEVVPWYGGEVVEGEGALGDLCQGLLEVCQGMVV